MFGVYMFSVSMEGGGHRTLSFGVANGRIHGKSWAAASLLAVRVCAERAKRMAWKIFDAAAAIQDGMARSRSAPAAARRSSSLAKPAASRGPGS
jgi:hypothetical protein